MPAYIYSKYLFTIAILCSVYYLGGYDILQSIRKVRSVTVNKNKHLVFLTNIVIYFMTALWPYTVLKMLLHGVNAEDVAQYDDRSSTITSTSSGNSVPLKTHINK